MVEQWQGRAGAVDIQRQLVAVTDTSERGLSPYETLSRQGATLVPRCLIFVNETSSMARIQTSRTVTVNPRRGNLDKEPWRSLELATLSSQTIEAQHSFAVHLGETVVPYATLAPLSALLPVRNGKTLVPVRRGGVGGVEMSTLGSRMRTRWQFISELWEKHKGSSNRLNLLERLNYMGNMNVQLEWQQEPGDRPFRVVYTGSGRPTAALITENQTLIDYTLFWIACSTQQEAWYLQTIINSEALYKTVFPLMAKGQFGARHLQKHLWKLPIPKYEETNDLHRRLSSLGQDAGRSVSIRIDEIRKTRNNPSVTILRREIRSWLSNSIEGRIIEDVVSQLLEEGAKMAN